MPDHTDPDRLDRQDIAPRAPYDHPDHGRVVVTLVADDVVYYEQPANRLTNSQFTKMHIDPLDRFARIATPLPQRLDLPSATAAAATALGES